MSNASVLIETDRFFLRELSNGDVTKKYLGWLWDQDAKRFIESAPSIHDLTDLQKYVQARTFRDDVLFLGIFEKSQQSHIGNIKYEPVNSELRYAVMGILIGEPIFRGQNVTGEVIGASARWLAANRNIREIILRVSDENTAAVRAYRKIGFEVSDSSVLGESIPKTTVMSWTL